MLERARARSRSASRRPSGRAFPAIQLTVATAVGACLVLAVAMAATVSAQHPEMNPALLGVVTAPAHHGVQILHVLKQSPAEEAGLAAGDVLQRVGGEKVDHPDALNNALSKAQPGNQVELQWNRDDESHSATATVVHWRSYRGGFLRGRAQGQTGFEAPEWYAYAWAQTGSATPEGSSHAAAPTRENTEGKVVVIHAFQSW